ncbi:hypothetical protein [Bradyrhizobium sp. USDA 4452]
MSNDPVKAVTEVIPAVEGEPSAIASANAPFIFLDGAVTYGFGEGIGNVTLEALRFGRVNGKIVTDRVAVAHLRMGIIGLRSLKGAIDAMLLQSMPAENSEEKPS